LLEHTFIHIQGIGPKTEQKLWQRGILTWEHFLNNRKPLLPSNRDPVARIQLKASVENHDNVRFFSERLPVSERWRVFDRFKGNAVYLDIETSGRYLGVDEITVIGIYDGSNVRTFISGQNLEEFEAAITDYDLVITFNGGSFDLPFIRRTFPNISLPPGHIDLRYVFNSLGYRGGLKRIEKELGISRAEEIDGMDGWEAVRLWREYQWGDQAALDLLVKYNSADIVNLAPLMEMGYKRMKKNLLPQIQAGSGQD